MEVQTAAPAPGTPAPAAAAPAAAAPAAAPASAAPAIPSWTDGFDASQKDYIAQKGFQDNKALLDSYVNLEKLRGVPAERLLKIPEAPDAPEWNDIYSKLGKPATAEGYGIQPADPKQPAFSNWAKETFLKNNLTQAQGQELVKAFTDFQTQAEADAKVAHTQKVQEQTGLLKKEWGAAYDQNVNRARAAYRQFGIPDAAIDSLENTIGFDGVMKMFHKLGSQIGEHDYINGSGPGDKNLVLTPDQAKARIKALKSDKAWADKYLNKSVAEVQEMERLQKMAYPSES